MAYPIPSDMQKKHKVNGYYRLHEKEFVEAYLKEHGITLRQFTLKLMGYQVPENHSFL